MMADSDPLWDNLGDTPDSSPLAAGKPAAGGDADPLWDNLGPQPADATDPLAPAPKPTGPPRLKGQRTPPPRPRAGPGPPARPGGPPTAAPPPAPDPSWGQVFSGALQHALPSFAGQVEQTVAPFLPQNWMQDARGMKAIGQGLLSKAGIIDQGNRAAQQQHQAAVNAIGKMYADRYGSVSGFKRTLQNDPFAIGSDIAALATIPIGGEGLAAKVPGALGTTLRAAGKVGRAAQLADPAVLAAETLGGAGRLGVRGMTAVAKAHPRLAHGVGETAKRSIGAGIGTVVGSHFGAPGAGAIVGERIAERVPLPHFGAPPTALGKVASGAARAGTAALPVAGAFEGMQPMSPGEQVQAEQNDQDQGGGGGPPAGGSGDVDNDTIANQIMYHEGGLGGQKNPGSSAQGPFQMTDDTWVKEYRRQNPRESSGMTRDQILDVRHSDAGQQMTPQLGRSYIDYEAGLVKNLGMPVTPRNVYLVHFLGESAGPRLLQALRDDPSVADQPIEKYIGQAALSANPQLKGKRTVQDFLDWADGAMQDGQTKWAKAQARNQPTQLAQGYADGGQVVSLVDRLMSRAERTAKETRSATKPLLGLDDETVHKALAIAAKAI